MRLWFESHATSVDNEVALASGHFDVELSENGRGQAVELGERYARCELSAVYTSDLKRAASTAEIAFAQRPLPHLRDARLRECDYGTWTRCPLSELEAARVEFVDHRFPDGESFRDVVRRVEDFLNLLPRGEGQLLVIGHRAPWYAFEHLLKGRDLVEVIRAPWKWQPGWEYTL